MKKFYTQKKHKKHKMQTSDFHSDIRLKSIKSKQATFTHKKSQNVKQVTFTHKKAQMTFTHKKVQNVKQASF